MGWFANFFKKSKERKVYASMLNGYTPIFSQFGQDIYASDVVQQAIMCIAMEMKKLNPCHICKNDSDEVPVNGSIQRLLNDPNPLMTTSDFIEKIIWQLYFNYNSFIIPTYTISTDKDGNKRKKYTGLWPVQPSQVEFLQDTSDELYIKFTFANNYETTIRKSDVIHLKYKFSVNEFMGGNEFGQPDNKPLLDILNLNHTLLDGVQKGLKSSFTINGVIKYNTLLDGDKMDNAVKELERHLNANESGFLPLDMKGEFIPLKRDTQLVDDSILRFIDSKILRYFGVSLPILTGDYTKTQYEAFYQKTLEPLIIQIGQEFTKIMFTDREKSFGNSIVFYPHELIFLDTTQKISLFDILVDSGACYKNELRTAFGMKPLSELNGQLAMSSNKTNAENNKTDISDNSKSDNTENQKNDDEETDNKGGKTSV